MLPIRLATLRSAGATSPGHVLPPSVIHLQICAGQRGKEANRACEFLIEIRSTCFLPTGHEFCAIYSNFSQTWGAPSSNRPTVLVVRLTLILRYPLRRYSARAPSQKSGHLDQLRRARSCEILLRSLHGCYNCRSPMSKLRCRGFKPELSNDLSP